MNTFWNFEPAQAMRGTAVVADTSRFPSYWARTEGIIGQRIPVVLVAYYADRFYLDDRDGQGWFKVTDGRGSPMYGHRDVVIEPDSFELSAVSP